MYTFESLCIYVGIYTSSLQADNDQVLGFSETFYLKQLGESLFIMNDFFRLALHHQ